MARLMLTVGDFQASVQPVPGSVSEAVRALGMLPDGHPLGVGDHEVAFYEINPDSKQKEHFCSAIMGENDALQLVAAWLQVDEQGLLGRVARERIVEAFPDADEWLLP